MNRDEVFTIKDVVNLLGIPIYDDRGSDAYVQCPYCGKRHYKASICVEKDGVRKDGFHCFSCDNRANSYKLYADMKGIVDEVNRTRFQIARKRIIEALNLGYSEKTTSAITYKTEKKAKKRRSAKDVNEVYLQFMKELKLNQKHIDQIVARGLTEEQAKMFFRSVPFNDDEAKSICRRLIKKGLKLNEIPGFSKNDQNDWTFPTRMKGYFIPVPNIHNQIQGFQVRIDNPKSENKYIWLASKGKNGGITSGSPCAIHGNTEAEEIYFVDGTLKALVCNLLYQKLSNKRDKLFVGPAGVEQSSWIESAIKDIVQKGRAKKVINAFDMDEFMSIYCDDNYKGCNGKCEYKGKCLTCPKKEEKINNLSRASEKLKEVAHKYRLFYKRVYWDMDGDVWAGNIKGLDDYLQYIITKEKTK